MQLVAAPDDPCVRGATRVGCLSLLQVVDVLDLRLRPEPVVVATKVRLTVREEDRLVLRAAERRDGEVPPLREEHCGGEHNERERDVAEAPAMFDEPTD